MDLDALRFRWRLFRHDVDRWFESNVLWKIPPLLPHRVVDVVLSYAGVAAIRGDEVVPDVPFTVVLERWHKRDLQGRAARRHPRRPTSAP